MVRSVISLLILAVAGIRWQAQAPAFSVVEASIPEMQAAMKEGRITSREIVRQYLTRIALYEDKLNAVITRYVSNALIVTLVTGASMSGLNDVSLFMRWSQWP